MLFNIWSLTLAIFAIIFVIFIKLAFELLCLKNGCKIKFELGNNFLSLKNFNVKFKNKKLEINIDKIWLSSSSINNSIKRLVTVCFNVIQIKYSTSAISLNAAATNNINKQINDSDVDLDQIFSSYLLTILKIIGINIKNLRTEINNKIIECKKVEIDVEKNAKLKLLIDDLNVNYAKRGVEVKIDKILTSICYLNINKHKIYSSTKFKLQATQIHVLNPCVSLSLINNSDCFSLKDYLERLTKEASNEIIESSPNSFFDRRLNIILYQMFATKLVLLKVDKLNIKIEQNEKSLENILIINEIKYLIPSALNDLPSTACESNKFSIKNVTYVSQKNQIQNLLLNKFILNINSLKSINLSGYCDSANVYINFKLFKAVIDYLSYKLYLANKNSFFNSNTLFNVPSNANKLYKNFKNLLKKQIFIEFKVLNGTLNLLNQHLTYSLNVRKLFIKYSCIKSKFSNETCIDLSLNHFIIFRSDLKDNSIKSSFFDKLSSLNTTKTHYLDTILFLNILEFKFQNSLKLNLDLFIDNFHFEYYINDLVKLRKFFQSNEVLFDNIMFYLSIKNLSSNGKKSKSMHNSNQKVAAPKLKAMLKTANFYLIHRNNICTYFEVTDAFFNNDNCLNEIKSSDNNILDLNNSMIQLNENEKLNNLNLDIKKVKCFKFFIQSTHNSSSDDLRHSTRFIQTSSHVNSSLLMIKTIKFRKYHENSILNSNNSSKSSVIYNRLYLNIHDVHVSWSLNTHLMIFETYKKISPVLTMLKIYHDKLKVFKSPSKIEFEQPVVLKVNIVLESDILFNILTDYSQDSTMNSNLKQVISIIPSNFYLFLTQNGVKASASSIVLNIDDVKFIKMQNFVTTYSIKDKTLHLERKSLNAEAEFNKLLFLKADSVIAKFAHNYDYAKLIDHVVNFKKFFQVLHKKKVVYIKQSLPLPCDLIIKVNKFRAEIEDDPFEIKLDYNYALMLDEYHESVKRRQKLNERQLIKDKHLENQAYEILKEREAYVYIQRSKKMYEKPIRTQLFIWSANDIDLQAIIDPKWNGTENCIKMLKKIDKESTLPANVSFLILWCRYVNLNIKNTKLIFRDYAQPFLQLNEFHIWGYFLVSEIAPSVCAVRDIILTLDESKMKFKMQRSISPLKFYHDASSKCQFFRIAYGPCKEGTMAQFNLALDKIIQPPRNPSQPLPWWDKSRLYFHGRLSIFVEHLQWLYHVSMDPNNRTEEMKWIWSNLFFDWTNQRLFFAGNLEIFLNTASKYDDCRILFWPNLEMLVKIEWLCKQGSNPNDHNYIMPSMPDKIPVESLSNYDAYQFFRSENLNLKFNFNSFPKTKDQCMPIMKFYASTLRFLQRIKDMFALITRPTSRGKIFSNLRPRKPLFSRHLKFVHFQFYIPKFDIMYWSSASEQYGFQLNISSYSIDSKLKLDLIDPIDKLIRRKISSWSIDLMEVKTGKTIIYLKSPSKNHKPCMNTNSGSPVNSSSEFAYDNEFSTVMENERSIKFLDSAPVIRNFLLQVDYFTYRRESKSQTSSKNSQFIKKTRSREPSVATASETPLHKIQIVNLKGKWNNINRDVVYTLYDIYHKAKVLRHNLSSMALKQIMLQENSQIIFENYVHEQAQKTANVDLLRNISSISTNSKTSFLEKSDKLGINLNESQFKGSYADKMLQKLVSEYGINSEVYINDSINETANFNDLLYGVHAATKMNDILNENVHVEFINSQIKLNLESFPEVASRNSKTGKIGIETPESGYLIISAAKADVIQRLHQPVCKNRNLLDKVTWHGHLECMQYFATLKQFESPNTVNESSLGEYWLSSNVIDPTNLTKMQKNDPNNNEFFNKYCSKNTLGMIISPSFENSQNASENEESINECLPSEKLQLIASKCRCEFFMIDFNEKIITEEIDSVQQQSINVKTFSNIDLHSTFKEPLNSFTLIHDELNLCTNRSQFHLIFEIVNSLVLYFRPKKKQVIDRLKSLKFNLQLSSGDVNSLKEHIKQKQIEIKEILSKLRILERQIFYLAQKIQFETENLDLQHSWSMNDLKTENIKMEKEYKLLKTMLNNLSDELNVSISCFKEVMLEQRIMCMKKTSFANINNSNKINENSDLKSVNEDSESLDGVDKFTINFNENINNGATSSHKSFSKNDEADDEHNSDMLNEIGRRYEIWFKSTQWKLTEPAGLNESAQFTMKNFLYTKVANQQEFDCVEHTLEVESCRIQDLTPDQSIENNDVLNSNYDFTIDESIDDITSLNQGSSNLFPENKTIMLRLFCKQRPPVNYISVIEHLELNLSPIRIRLTHRFFKMLMKFFFEMEDVKKYIPINNSNELFESNGAASSSKKKRLIKDDGHENGNDINSQYSEQIQFMGGGESMKNDDIEIMKKRSDSNNTFICIKIPEIPLLVSYKGYKENNIKDLNNVRLLFPLFEVNNKTW